MPKYRVYGEYGPIGGMSIEDIIEADNEDEAVTIFCERMETENPVAWDRMGRRNVYIYEHIKD